MKRLSIVLAGGAAIAMLGLAAGTMYRAVHASDHDDGESDAKARALNLTDHYVFKTPGETDKLTLIMYFNPRSLPGFPYFMSTQARYEFHVSRSASATATPTGASDVVFRFEATGSPDASGVQPVKLTVIVDGDEVGTHDGSSTAFRDSQGGDVTTNTATIGGHSYDYFVGMRQDSFHFDVIRFFQVRAFLAARFYGGDGGGGNASAALAPNCRGDAFLGGILGGEQEPADADGINLFNPPSCAPDFTKNYNVTSITLNVPIAALQASGETVFDTWSTISVPR